MSNPPPYAVGFNQPGQQQHYPSAPGQYFPPQDNYPGTQGYAPSQGQYPPPQGQYPPPQGQYPALQGQYPAPQGQYPPLQYPSPQGQYPPPHGQFQPPKNYPQPISAQPQGYFQPNMDVERPDGWMNIPRGVPVNCPPGLEYLANIDQLLVHQKVELLEALIGFETANKYTIKNSLGQKVYYAVEESGCCGRNCCGPIRPFEMKILDNFRNQVMHFSRPLACQSCCFPCCLQSLEVFAPPGNYAGRIDQEWSILTPTFSIKNASGDIVLKIEGPICRFGMCGGDVPFEVLSADGSQNVGRISKQWSGLLREVFTDADYFGITFPMDLDVRMKAVMLGALFLMDYMFFEKTGNAENDRFGML